jgi:large subunit ribosomal protein L28
MTRQCELTGKKPMSGNRRSHAENKTKRVYRPNLVNVTLMSDVLDRKIKVRCSANGLKSVEHRGGLDAYLMKAHADELSADLLKMKREIQKAKAAAPAA